MPTQKLMGCQSSQRATEQGLTAAHLSLGISSLHFLKLVEDQGHIGFWSMDFSTGRISGSIGMYRLLSLPPSATLDFTALLKMMHPNDRILNSDTITVMRSGQAIRREFRVIRRDSTMRWIENKAEVLVDTEGVPKGALGLFTDVTEHHEARVIVEEGWQSYDTLISAIAVVKWRMLPNGKITSLLNWEELTGQTLVDADNWGWADAIHPDEREAALSLWAECTATRRPYAIDIRIRTVAGIYRNYLVRGAQLYNSDGTFREWICVLIEAPVVSLARLDSLAENSNALNVAYIRAARGLLDWSTEDLALKSGVSASTIRRLERSAGIRTRLPHVETILTALQNGGVRFGHGPDGEVSISLTAIHP